MHIILSEDPYPDCRRAKIGQVLLDKLQPRIQTVVHKLGNVGDTSEYRTFEMQVLAGKSDEGWSQVAVKEEGCVFVLTNPANRVFGEF